MAAKRKKVKQGKKIDDSINSVPAKQIDVPPQIYAISTKQCIGRRTFFKKISGKVAGLSAIVLLGEALTSCKDTYTIDIEKDMKTCTCHVVCTCNKYDKDGTSSIFGRDISGNICTCDTVWINQSN